MINQVDLFNYKSYEDSHILLKPITLLTGGNSSGKTSILKSILLMKQSFEASGNNYLLINGVYTNNGLYANTRRTGNDSDMSISLSFDIDQHNPSFNDICRSMGMLRRDAINRFRISAAFQFQENKGIPQVGEINSSIITLFTDFNERAEHFPGETVQSQIKMMRCGMEQHYSIYLTKFPTPLYFRDRNEYPFDFIDFTWENCTCYFRGMQLVSLYKEGLSKRATSTLPVLYTLFRTLTSELERVEYIGPLREAPMRHYFLSDVYSDIGVKGENTAHYLGQLGTSMINTPLPGNSTAQTVTLNDAVSKWADYLGIEKVSVVTTDVPSAKITQIMIGEQNIVDVGFGVSQVLPILVEGLTMARGGTLILEQPEIHLHPRMQMDIADFLVMMARQGKNLIIETHSDHIINRIIRRALEDQRLREIIGIYYVEKDKNNNSQLTEIRIDEHLGIDEAPNGFFDQYASETEQILQAGYKNMQLRRDRTHDETNH